MLSSAFAVLQLMMMLMVMFFIFDRISGCLVVVVVVVGEEFLKGLGDKVSGGGVFVEGDAELDLEAQLDAADDFLRDAGLLCYLGAGEAGDEWGVFLQGEESGE